MKTDIRNRARDWALQVLNGAHIENGSMFGTCEDCNSTDTKLFFAGCGFTCHKCYVQDLMYWESRGGFSSESLFDSLGFNRSPEDSSRVYRSAMGAYWVTLIGAK
jgi:hypothetical protein